jgi:hypothetical protein
MSTSPIENLEQRAQQERRELHERAEELKIKARIVRQNLDITRNARLHFGGAAAILATVGLISGYAFGGLFTGR